MHSKPKGQIHIHADHVKILLLIPCLSDHNTLNAKFFYLKN